MTVLVLTRTFDPTADLVIARLHERAVPLFRMDTADFPERIAMTAQLDAATGRWHGELRDEHRAVNLSDIRAVYYRRPTAFRVHPGMSDTEARWSMAEARHGVAGVLATLECTWVNNPQANAAASLKPLQLRVAAECGLAVPDTLATNSPRAAREFIASLPGSRGVCKSFAGPPTTEAGQLVGLPTTIVTAQEVTGGVARTAHQFQQWVDGKVADVRLTVVGKEQFACRIDTDSTFGRVDFRTAYADLKYTPIKVPNDVASGVAGLMRHFNLFYGALDFVLDDSGRWTFLELNPNGQFGFVSEQTGQPIPETIARLLAEGTTTA